MNRVKPSRGRTFAGKRKASGKAMIYTNRPPQSKYSVPVPGPICGASLQEPERRLAKMP